MSSSTTVAMVTITSTSITQLALLYAVGMLLVTADEGNKAGLNRYARLHTAHNVVAATCHIQSSLMLRFCFPGRTFVAILVIEFIDKSQV